MGKSGLSLILTFSPGEKEQQTGVSDFSRRVRKIQSSGLTKRRCAFLLLPGGEGRDEGELLKSQLSSVLHLIQSVASCHCIQAIPLLKPIIKIRPQPFLNRLQLHLFTLLVIQNLIGVQLADCKIFRPLARKIEPAHAAAGPHG